MPGSSKSGASLSVVERYSPKENLWRDVAPTLTTRSGLGAAVLDDQLYIFGGASDTLFGSVVLSTVERYDATADSWRAVRHSSRSPYLATRHPQISGTAALYASGNLTP